MRDAIIGHRPEESLFLPTPYNILQRNISGGSAGQLKMGLNDVGTNSWGEPRSVRLTSAQVFRIAADLSHITAKCILIFSIHRNRSAEGLSVPKLPDTTVR